MPSRRPLTELTNVQRRGKDLTPYERGQIKAHKLNGNTHVGIAKIMKNTISAALKRDSVQFNGQSQPRSGAPLKTTARDRRRILHAVKKDPRISYARIRSENGLEVSDSTIYRVLQSFNIEHWIAKKRPFLSEDHAKARLLWCKERKNWTFEQWAKVIFTHECSLERGSGKQPTWI